MSRLVEYVVMHGENEAFIYVPGSKGGYVRVDIRRDLIGLPCPYCHQPSNSFDAIRYCVKAIERAALPHS